MDLTETRLEKYNMLPSTLFTRVFLFTHHRAPSPQELASFMKPYVRGKLSLVTVVKRIALLPGSGMAAAHRGGSCTVEEPCHNAWWNRLCWLVGSKQANEIAAASGVHNIFELSYSTIEQHLEWVLAGVRADAPRVSGWRDIRVNWQRAA